MSVAKSRNAESKFCISFGNRGPRVWRKPYDAVKPRCTKSSIKFPQSTMVLGRMSAAGVESLCFLQTNVTAAVYQEVLKHFLLPTAFQHDLAPAYNAKPKKTKIIRGLPRMGYRSCLSRQTLQILVPSKIFGESRRREWLLVDRLHWSS